MRRLDNGHSILGAGPVGACVGARGVARLVTATTLLALLCTAAVCGPRPAAGQPPEPPPLPAEQPIAPSGGVVSDEALERIDRALEAVEETIGEDGEDGSSVVRERRERIREIRDQVRHRLRNRSDRTDNRVSFGSGVHVEKGEVASDVVAIGGRVDVDGDVDGDLVAVGGPVSIDGRVTGDVVSVGGGVVLGSDAKVLGEVTSVGGKVERADGAEVMGRVNEVAFGPSFSWNLGDNTFHGWDWKGKRHFSPFSSGWFGFALSLTGVVVLLLLALLVRLVAGGTAERVRAKAVESPWLCGLVGLATELFFVPVLVVVCVILAISIIGIPLLLLIPFVVLAFLLAVVVGFTGVAQAVGEWVGRRVGRQAASPYAAIVVGVVAIQILHVIAELFDSFSGFLWFFAAMFGVVGFLVRYVAWTVGIGAVFLTVVRGASPGGGTVALPPLPGSPAGSPSGAPYAPPELPQLPAEPDDPEWSGQPVDDSRYQP